MSIVYLLTAFIALLALMLFVVATTTPSGVGPIGVLFVFLLIYASLVALLALFLLLIQSVLQRKKTKNLYIHTSFKRIMILSFVLAFAPLAILASQSLGQLSMYEFVLIVIFEIIAIFIVMRS